MLKRVLLMNPPSGLYRRDDRCQSKVDDQTVRVIFPPIELAMLAAVAREKSAEVMLRDYPAVGGRPEDCRRDLAAFRPDVVLLNTTVHTVREDMAVLAMARQLSPGVLCVAKGDAVAAHAAQTLPQHPELDVIIDGEAELTFAELVDGAPVADVQGIAWRDDNGLVHRNPARPLIEPLDQLPFPARDLLDNSLYRSPENGRPITAIHAQRGCPSRCIFCPAGSMFEYRVRERSVENVMAELNECVRRHGIRDYLFHGDTFTLHKKWLVDLCKAIVDSGLDIHWGCNSRVDTIDDERAEWLRRAGCWVVAFGFEHGVQEILDKMQKGQRVERAYDAVKVCRRAGLKVHGFFVIGMPWETRETLDRTYRFARSLDTDYFDFNIAYPLPGTEYYEIARSEGLFEPGDLTSGGYAQAAVRTYTMSSAELTAWRRKALLRMYARPSYVLRTLRQAMAGGNAGHYLRAARFRLGSLLKG